ncbi:serine protease [[Phormidium] sp. ETS-05]|uniref:S1 family peptidase n=1 Tax=[Phormidium] sp. ETS-05 TaxID=222819 RepID=UPI0018EEDD8D|nr:serine protease [[Phormidium] sp. ETS-05]
MKCRTLIMMVLFGTFVAWSVPALNAVAQLRLAPALRQPAPEARLRQIAESITVKILYGAAEGWGSGIIVRSEGEVYTVVTNQHVLRGGTSYQVQTPDGRIYSAQAIAISSFQDRDLAALRFRSLQTYQVATLATSAQLRIGDRVYAVGFPAQNPTARGFYFTEGQISLVTNQAFIGGYQIGYTNPVEKGMSGGPLLNADGEVIGVNGMHAYPLWGNPYIFPDGTTPPVAMQEQMRLLSWAIPIQNVFSLTSQSVPRYQTLPAAPVHRVEDPVYPVPPPPPPGFLW